MSPSRNYMSSAYAEDTPIARGADLMHRAANRVSVTSVLQVLALVSPVPEVWPTTGRYRHVVLDERTLLRYAANPAADMSLAFVRDAVARGDRCHAALDGDTLASYQWCSTRSTRINDRLLLTVPPGWTYKYKALTLERYRGQRLHAHLTSFVQQEAALRDDAVFACVEINNRASLRSFARMGAVRLGTLAAISVRGRDWTYGTPGCRNRGLQLVSKPSGFAPE